MNFSQYLHNINQLTLIKRAILLVLTFAIWELPSGHNLKFQKPYVTTHKNLRKDLKKLYGPFFMDEVQLPQGYSTFEEAVHLLPLSSQKYLVLNLSTLEGEDLSQPWSHQVVLNMGCLDWQCSTLTNTTSTHTFWTLNFNWFVSILTLEYNEQWLNT